MSKASRRVVSQRLAHAVMLPPTIELKIAPMLTKRLRERTTMPRTTPRFCRTRKPGSSKAVVTICGETEKRGSLLEYEAAVRTRSARGGGAGAVRVWRSGGRCGVGGGPGVAAAPSKAGGRRAGGEGL